VQYLGGKSRLAKRICGILEAARKPGQRFVDVFTGGANIVAGMSDRGPRVANDGCEPLIVLYRAWLDGWRPPDITREVWQAAKLSKDPADPLTAFCGFGVSFNGMWFSSFAAPRPKPRPRVPTGEIPAESAVRSLTAKLTRCSDVSFVCSDFAHLEILPGDLVYCDPPYRGTTAYGYFRGFDYDLYLSKLTEWSAIADVFVSEYAAQADTCEQIAEFAESKPSSMGSKIECLYRVR
jgi:DNA adenine methylase